MHRGLRTASLLAGLLGLAAPAALQSGALAAPAGGTGSSAVSLISPATCLTSKKHYPSAWTHIETAPDGETTVAWRRILKDGTAQLLTSTRASGGAWQRPVTLVEQNKITSMSLAVATGGRVVVAWRTTEKPKSIMASYRSPDGSWKARKVATRAKSITGLVMDETGRATVTWKQKYGLKHAEQWSSSSRAGRRWSSADRAAWTTGYLGPTRDAFLSSNAAGDLALARVQGGQVWVSSKSRSGAEWTQRRVPVVDGAALNADSLTVDEVGRPTLAYQSNWGSGRLPLAITSATDGSWPDAAHLLMGGGASTGVRSSTNGTGTTVATWTKDGAVYSARLTSAGWSGASAYTAPGSSSTLTSAVDDLGNVLVLWQGDDNGGRALFAREQRADGTASPAVKVIGDFPLGGVGGETVAAAPTATAGTYVVTYPGGKGPCAIDVSVS